MQNLPFTLRQLEIFESLAETRSFRRTSEILGISQASVSNQVKALEDQLGTALLLRRSGKRPDLTLEGELFLGDLRVFQAAALKLAGYRRRVAQPQTTARYRILLGQGLADHYVRPKLGTFMTEHPHIILEFDTRTPRSRLDAVTMREQFDFVLIHQEAQSAVHPGLRSLGRTPSGIFGDRRFAEGRALPLTATEVSRLPFVLSASNDDERERGLRRVLAQFELNPVNTVARVQFFDVILAMLERGQAVTNLPSAMIPHHLRSRIVMLFPMHDWRLVFSRKDTAPDPSRDAIERFLLESVLNDPNYPLIPG